LPSSSFAAGFTRERHSHATLSHAASAAAVAAGGECWPLTVLYKNIMFITKNEFKRHHD